MTFALATAPVETPTSTSLKKKPLLDAGWPEIDLATLRQVVRLNSTVTEARLIEAAQNAIYAVIRELEHDIKAEQITDERQHHLYRRAVYFTVKAELLERYRDFDTTRAIERHQEDYLSIADDARRNARWAIRDLLGRSRVTIEAL